jgi:predicted HAD superfamily Cof-like phosphohydrolase
MVALLFATLGSLTPFGLDTVAVFEIEPVAEELIVPVALRVT